MSYQQENLPSNVLKAVARELHSLIREDIHGIRVQYDDSNLTEITAIVEGPGECYITTALLVISRMIGEIK